MGSFSLWWKRLCTRIRIWSLWILWWYYI